MSWFAKKLDSFVGFVSPAAGMKRLETRFRLERAQKAVEDYHGYMSKSSGGSGGFKSASRGRDAHDWLTSGLSPQSAIEESRQEQLSRADSAYKNHELATNFVEGRVTRVVGCGTALEPDIEAVEGIAEGQAEGWNEFIRRKWEMQIERIGKGNKPLWKVQRVLQRHFDRHGEWFLLIGDGYDPLTPTTLKIEAIHPKRVETPPRKEGDEYCRDGIQLNEDNEAIGYWVRTKAPGDHKATKEEHEYYPAYLPNGLPRLIHEFDETEAGMHRGYPRMQVGLPRLKNSEDYSEAELERNYVAACHTAFVRTDIERRDLDTGFVFDSNGQRQVEMEPGRINYMGLNDEVTLSNPQGAPASYETFVNHQGRMFAVGAGAPYEVIANDYRGMSYSNSKAIHNIEDGNCAVAHKSQAETLVAVYRHFVTRLVLTGLLEGISSLAYRSEPWKFWAVRVIPPAKPSLDPAREDRGELVLAEAGIKPASELVERKNGKPASAVYKRVAKDRKDRRKHGLEEHMPQMGRDFEQQKGVPTQPGDTNEASSRANTTRQEVGA